MDWNVPPEHELYSSGASVGHTQLDPGAGEGLSGGNQNRVDHVDDPVGRFDIRGGDRRVVDLDTV